MTQINSERLNELLSTKNVVFVDFKADWCRPCHYLSTQLGTIVDKYSDKVTFVKVDVEDETELATKYEIRSIPTVLIFKDGEIAFRSVGMKSNNEFEDALKKIINA